jgi:hypothetical protein
MSLAPALLLSMPQLLDPNFAKSVVLLCEHAPEGAFGLVVNRPSEIAAAEAVRLEPPVNDPNDLPLLIGGPVEPERGWILTAQAPEHVEHRSVGAGLYLSASPVLLRRARPDLRDPLDVRVGDGDSPARRGPAPAANGTWNSLSPGAALANGRRSSMAAVCTRTPISTTRRRASRRRSSRRAAISRKRASRS